MNPEDAPKIEFPCDDYVIKIVGDSVPELKPFTTSVLKKYDSTVTDGSYRENPSKNGNFISLTVKMRIEKESHLTDLFNELKENALVRMVL